MDDRVVAVVDAHGTEVVIWHIDLGADGPGLSRMCGAWVLDGEPDKVELLTRGRVIVATPSGDTALKQCGAQPLDVIDISGTVENVAAEQERLQKVYEQQASLAKSTLVPPSWARLPEPIDVASPPVESGAPRQVSTALGIARWLERLAVSWADIERQRLIRSYLASEGERTPRRCPVQTKGWRNG